MARSYCATAIDLRTSASRNSPRRLPPRKMGCVTCGEGPCAAAIVEQIVERQAG